MSHLAVRQLDAFYGDFQALFGITLDVAEGETVAIIGANGSGKSTFLKAVAGALPVARAAVELDGVAVGGRPAHELVDRGVTLVPEGRRIFPSLTVEENLRIGAYRARAGRWTLERVYALFPRLAERIGQSGGTLSGGEQQMLAIGRAMMLKPRLLLLDEPSLGLAPLIVREIFRIVTGMRELGVSILLVEQNARAALETADYGYVLETGEIVHSGSAADLMHDPKVTASYLGGH